MWRPASTHGDSNTDAGADHNPGLVYHAARTPAATAVGTATPAAAHHQHFHGAYAVRRGPGAAAAGKRDNVISVGSGVGGGQLRRGAWCRRKQRQRPQQGGAAGEGCEDSFF